MDPDISSPNRPGRGCAAEAALMEPLPTWLTVKLTMIEYMLDVVMANNLAFVPEERSERFKQDLLSHDVKLPPRSGPVDVAELAAFQGLVRADLENFFRKVSARESSIREVLGAE